MAQANSGWSMHGLAIAAAAFLASAARAQPPAPDPEALIGPSLQVGSGSALARRQAGEGDLLGALGTVERVLIANPDAVPARLLYVSLLCRVDDREGAEVELGLLPRKPVPDDAWAEVAAACGAMTRPGGPRR